MGKHLTAFERSEIELMKHEGQTNKAIGEQMGYSRTRISDYFHNLRRKEQLHISGKTPSAATRKGRPRKHPMTPQQENELRIKELERENELLRSFLHAAGRR